MDWEDFNKLGFLMIVQTMIVKTPHIDASNSAAILFEAMKIKKAEIPADLEIAAKDFFMHFAFDRPESPWLKDAKRPDAKSAF
jgi:hypothetical protein